jgi:hypothetical protein
MGETSRSERNLRRPAMLTYTLPQVVFFLMVAGVAAMVFTIITRMLRA